MKVIYLEQQMYKTGLRRETMGSVLHLDHAYPRQKMVYLYMLKLNFNITCKIKLKKKTSKFATKHSNLLQF